MNSASTGALPYGRRAANECGGCDDEVLECRCNRYLAATERHRNGAGGACRRARRRERVAGRRAGGEIGEGRGCRNHLRRQEIPVRRLRLMLTREPETEGRAMEPKGI